MISFGYAPLILALGDMRRHQVVAKECSFVLEIWIRWGWKYYMSKKTLTTSREPLSKGAGHLIIDISRLEHVALEHMEIRRDVTSSGVSGLREVHWSGHQGFKQRGEAACGEWQMHQHGSGLWSLFTVSQVTSRSSAMGRGPWPESELQA